MPEDFRAVVDLIPSPIRWATAVAALASFVRNVLVAYRTAIELRKLRGRGAQEELVARPTPKDISQYGRKYDSSVKKGVLYGVLTVGLLALSIIRETPSIRIASAEDSPRLRIEAVSGGPGTSGPFEVRREEALVVELVGLREAQDLGRFLRVRLLRASGKEELAAARLPVKELAVQGRVALRPPNGWEAADYLVEIQDSSREPVYYQRVLVLVADDG